MVVFVRLVQVLDAGFVDQGPGMVFYLDSVAIVPLNVSLNTFAVFQDEDHRRLGLRLLLKVENLGVGALVSVVFAGHCFMVRESGEIVSPEEILAA